MQVALIEPEIPQNVGSIARTCAATGSPLHLVGPLPFDLSSKPVRRAGLDYWPYVEVHRHLTLAAFLEVTAPRRIMLIDATGAHPYYDTEYHHDDILAFPNEVRGVTADLKRAVPPPQVITIPLSSTAAGGLNLSNQVAIVLFEALRQGGFASDVIL